MSSSVGAPPADQMTQINVDVIIPVHNSAETIVETVESALHQTVPDNLKDPSGTCTGSTSSSLRDVHINISVCCYDDGSTDDSLRLLRKLRERHKSSPAKGSESSVRIPTRLLIGTNDDGVARGAGFARNRAADLGKVQEKFSPNGVRESFICLLDSDDKMHPHRIAEQLSFMLSIPNEPGSMVRDRTLLGCTFNRIPEGSTWHYTEWANGLTDERLMLERFREVTVLQPTWMLTRRRFEELGGYVEAPHPGSVSIENVVEGSGKAKGVDSQSSRPLGQYHLIHPTYDTPQTLRLAEDLRFFHEHLRSSGLLRLCRTPEKPLVTYRHRAGLSQSSSTSRRLLLHLRVLAFENEVLRSDPRWSRGFAIWGAGRDGKDFFKALSSDLRGHVRCFVDVDEKKILAGYYANGEMGVKIPIVHFALLARNAQARETLSAEWIEGEDGIATNDSGGGNSSSFGRIDKGRRGFIDNCSKLKEAETVKVACKRQHEDKNPRPKKRRRKLHTLLPKDEMSLDLDSLPKLPVVVCVAMYRTGGVLEKNVRSIGRTEGADLWHFS